MNSAWKFVQRCSLKTKLMLGLSGLLLMATAIGLEGWLGQRALSLEIRQLYEQELLGVSAIKEAQFQYGIVGRSLRQAVLAQEETERERALTELNQARDALQQALAATRQQGSARYDPMKLAALDGEMAQTSRNVQRAIQLLHQKGRSEELLQYVASEDFQRPGFLVNERLIEMARQTEAAASEAAQKAQALAERGQRLMVLLVGGGLAFGLLLGGLVDRSIRLPIEHIRRSIEALAAGKNDQPIPHTDLPNEIGDLARSIQVLQAEAVKMDAQRWIKTQHAAISNDLQAVSDFTELARLFFSRLAPLIHLGQGVFYLYEAERAQLRLLLGYAYRERKQLNQHFALGEGLVGQCALERQPIVIQCPPEDYIRIGSSLGEAPPQAIVVLPVLRGERLLAVIELATCEGLGSKEQILLEGLLPILAMNLEILERNLERCALRKPA